MERAIPIPIPFRSQQVVNISNVMLSLAHEPPSARTNPSILVELDYTYDEHGCNEKKQENNVTGRLGVVYVNIGYINCFESVPIVAECRCTSIPCPFGAMTSQTTAGSEK